MAHFNTAIELVLKHEGGYANDPRDRGGETNFGICRRSYPSLDIKGLTRAQAVEIYWRDYWEKNCYSQIVSDALSRKVFDIAVNVGPARANRWLQQAVNECLSVDLPEDGIIGPRTLAAVNALDSAVLLVKFLHKAWQHYQRLRFTQATFINNWMKRLWDI